MSKGIGLLPNGIYATMLLNTHKVMRPMRQLQLELLREGLARHFDWQCDHDGTIMWSRNKRIWYCFNCGQIFERNNPETAVPETWELIKQVTSGQYFGSLNMDFR